MGLTLVNVMVSNDPVSIQRHVTTLSSPEKIAFAPLRSGGTFEDMVESCESLAQDADRYSRGLTPVYLISKQSLLLVNGGCCRF